MTIEQNSSLHSSLLQRQEAEQTDEMVPSLHGDHNSTYDGQKPAPFSPTTLNNRAQKNFEIRCHQTLSSAWAQKEFTARISDMLEQLGFTAFSFTSVAREPYMLFSSLPDSLSKTYNEEGLIKDDYAICYGRSRSRPILRSSIENYMAGAPVETPDMSRNRTLSELYKHHGFFDCYLVPLFVGEKRFLFTVTAESEDICGFYDTIAAHAQDIALLGKLIVQLGSLKFKATFDKPDTSEQVNLTPKPLRLIKTLAREDLTLAQTADKLCISIHTADKHIHTVKKALGARTISGAVYMAIKAGIVDIE